MKITGISPSNGEEGEGSFLEVLKTVFGRKVAHIQQGEIAVVEAVPVRDVGLVCVVPAHPTGGQMSRQLVTAEPTVTRPGVARASVLGSVLLSVVEGHALGAAAGEGRIDLEAVGTDRRDRADGGQLNDRTCARLKVSRHSARVTWVRVFPFTVVEHRRLIRKTSTWRAAFKYLVHAVTACVLCFTTLAERFALGLGVRVGPAGEFWSHG